jgi:diacylglycerol kinase (ATP)
LKEINRHIAIICNPKSGKGKPLQLLPLVEAQILKNGFSSQSFVEQLPSTLETFTDLIIMGGDGTINYTINHFRKIAIPIGLIRCGTGNDFTELLLGKKSVEESIQIALFAEAQSVDAGLCNDRLFLNGAGIGFDGWIVKNLLAKKLFTGKAAYFSTVISLLLFYKERTITITIDEDQFTNPLFMLSAANGKTYGGGFKIAPKASWNDGLLECVWVKKISLPKRLRYLPVLEKGKHLDKPLSFIQYQRAKNITIESEYPLHAHLDGEHLEAKRFDIKTLPWYFSIRYQ